MSTAERAEVLGGGKRKGDQMTGTGSGSGSSRGMGRMNDGCRKKSAASE